MAKFKAGDKIVFGRGEKNKQLMDLTIGKIYLVENCDGSVVVVDDAGDHYEINGMFAAGKPTKIID